MADKTKPSSEDTLREEARQALRTFEHILEIMPDDQGTLEAVIMAAEQCGEAEKALNNRMHLVEVLLAHGDAGSASDHITALRSSDDPRARSWLAAHDLKERGMANMEVVAASREPLKTPAAGASRIETDISGEIDLAWKLLEHEYVSQEEYAALVKDLTEVSSANRDETVSVLHALESSHHKNLEQILMFVSQSSRTPYISLACFTVRAELLPFLRDDFIAHRGALVFEMMGRELLVGVLNPFNTGLRAAVEKEAGRPCHFYLVRASEFEEARKRLRETVQAS